MKDATQPLPPVGGLAGRSGEEQPKQPEPAIPVGATRGQRAKFYCGQAIEKLKDIPPRLRGNSEPTAVSDILADVTGGDNGNDGLFYVDEKTR